MKQSLKQGDIIIFKAEDAWLSQAIAWLTDSDVCHAAMVYSEDYIVEMGAKGISLDKMKVFEGDEAYVLRLSDEQDTAPLIEAADAYLNAKVRYDFPALVLVGGLLLYHKLTPREKVLKAVNNILAAACLALDDWIQHTLLHHTGEAMMCSQLVYQIYYDCGDAYRIQLTDCCVSNSSNTDVNSGTIKLIDLLQEQNAPADCIDSSCKEVLTKLSLPLAFTEVQTENAAKELYLALSDAETNAADSLLENELCDTSSTLTLAGQFITSLTRLMELLHCDMPIDALFVTPCDILYHSQNLEQLGLLSLTRIHEADT